jgi:hypothetical protein
MSLDEVALGLQRLVDRTIRRVRLGAAPARSRRRLLIVQIDGLSRLVLERALAEARVPFLARLLGPHGHRLAPMNVGLPTSTPAFQMAVMYGVRPDIPGFHYHDKRQRADVYFPRAGDAARVEAAHAKGRRGILEGGSAYGCVFTGGAANNVFNFATIKRPSGRGLLRAISAFVVLTWVLIKCLTLTAVEVAWAVLRFVADPVGETARGWRWLVLKLGLSVWVRQFFTLAASRDLYKGVPAVYVNYLDYDVFAHAYGPRHHLALRALRRVDRSIHQLWRVARRVSEHGYDLYVLSDHGMARCTPYARLSGGRPFEEVFFEDFVRPTVAVEVSPLRPAGRGLATGIKAYRAHRTPGILQRFYNYLERDFPWILGETPEARQRLGIRVIAAGPNAFVYLLDVERPVGLEEIDQRCPGLADHVSGGRGIGFGLARSARGPVLLWRGKRFALDGEAVGPFIGRHDWLLVAQGIRDLMTMPSAGDLVIYGHGSPDGNVSYVPEIGAHAGPSPEEMQTFMVAPPGVELPAPITHPIQLHPYFTRYQER